MQAGFNAYSRAVKHHSLVLTALREEVDELKQANVNKDFKISGLEEAKVKMAADIEEHKEARVRMVEEHERSRVQMAEEHKKFKVRMTATIEEHVESRIRMAAAIEDLEKRMNDTQQNNGTKTVK